MTLTQPTAHPTTTKEDRMQIAKTATTLVIGILIGLLAGWLVWQTPTNTRDADLMSSFRTSSGATQTFDAAACDIVDEPGAVVIRTPRGFIYDAVRHNYDRYGMYTFTASNNGDGTYGLISEAPQAQVIVGDLDNASAC